MQPISSAMGAVFFSSNLQSPAVRKINGVAAD